MVEQTHHRRQRFACNLSGGTRSDPTISPIARSTMITTSSFRRPVALLPCGGVPGLARRYSEAAEESVYDGACVSKSSREPSVVAVCAGRARGSCTAEARSVHSAGIRDLLPSGKIRMRCSLPLRCVDPRTSSDLPSNGWRARIMVTLSGRC